MANYNPPLEDLPIFDSLVFLTGDEPLTYNEAVKKFLKYPIAQGTENLQAITVSGTSTFNNNIIQNGNFNIAQTTSTNLVNDFKPSKITSTWGTTLTNPTLSVVNSGGAINFYPLLPATSFNPMVLSNDRVIYSNGQSLVLTMQNTVYSGIRISGSSTTLGFGSATSNPTSSVVADASTVSIKPSITFPDNKVQTSAFTGGTPGSYLNADITIDANGKISAISNGTTIPTFVPKAANFANYNSGSTGSSAGTKILWAGTWGPLDYIILRLTVQGNWINLGTGNGWENFAVSSGQLIIRPHFAPSGSWASDASPIRYTTNSGGNVNNSSVKKAVYYTGNINNGTQDYFYLTGNNGSIQLKFAATGALGGWEYTNLVEYITHSTSGGTVSFLDGNGTNNSLP